FAKLAQIWKLTILAALAFGRSVRQVVTTAAWKGIAAAASGGRIRRAPIDAARGQIASMDRLSKNPSNLLRERPMLSGGAPAQRLFQFVRHVSADENSFTISHSVSSLLVESDRRNRETALELERRHSRRKRVRSAGYCLAN